MSDVTATPLYHAAIRTLLLAGLTLGSISGSAVAAETTMERPPLRSTPTLRKLPAQQPAEQQAPQGGSGVYVLDNVDFHPVGGGEIPGLGWNNKVTVGGYYNYQNNSYLIVSGTVHGAGLISGPGQDGWTFMVKLDTSEITANLPSGCSFSRPNQPQTDINGTAWKYKQMIVFRDTATKPACFDYFKSLQGKPFAVKLIDIVGPYWFGDKQYQEPKLRLYQTGPMLSPNSNFTTGHDAQLWLGQ